MYDPIERWDGNSENQRKNNGILSGRLKPLILLLPLLILLRGFNNFPYPSESSLFSDISISHYPNALVVVQALLEGRLPLWSTHILSGFPFAANPLAGLWYPPGWLALLFPLPFGFNLTAGLHLVWGAVGLYLFLRSRGNSQYASILGGLAFGLMPKLIAHYGAGHLTLVYAVAWTPWLLHTTSREHVRRLRFRYWPATILALIFLADVRWALYAGVLWIAWDITQSHFPEIFSIQNRTSSFLRRLRPRVLRIGLQIFFAVLLSAVLLVPFVEYTMLSTRSNMQVDDTLTLSLPPARLLNLFFPDLTGGNHEWTIYGGVAIFLLVSIGLFSGRLWQVERFWVITTIVCLLFSLGDNIPGMNFLAHIPGFSLLRVPPRALFLLSMAMAIMAARSLDLLITGQMEVHQRKIKLLLVAFAAFPLILAAAASFAGGKIPASMIWGSASALLACIVLFIGVSRPIFAGRAAVLLVIVAGLDLFSSDIMIISFRTGNQVISEQIAVANYLKAQGGRFRVYSPSYSLPQQTAIRTGLELADGVDPLQLEKYTDFMQEASSVPSSGYSVTLPPFHNGEPYRDNLNFVPDTTQLGLLNVRYIVAEFEIDSPNLLLKQTIGKTRIYENQDYLPRAWLHTPGITTKDSKTTVNVLDWKPGKITLQAQGPALLVLSEIYYPGWTAFVDGQMVEIQRYADILQSVQFTAGEHTIRFEFRPISVAVGACITLSTFLLLTYITFRARTVTEEVEA